MEIEQLSKIDASVRAHEMAHLMAAGVYARSGTNYKYERGPNGKEYAVGGDVLIDTSTASTPEATIRKMETVRRAALAPIDPSPQDRKVAAEADAQIGQATQQLMRLQQEKTKEAAQKAATQTAQGAAGSASAGTGNGSTAGGTTAPASSLRSPAQAAAAYRNTGLGVPNSSGLHLLA